MREIDDALTALADPSGQPEDPEPGRVVRGEGDQGHEGKAIHVRLKWEVMQVGGANERSAGDFLV
ncbi:hypothetical protein GCM10009525_23100 [Streptosporangium amethystogenes subsp. fukuiense]